MYIVCVCSCNFRFNALYVCIHVHSRVNNNRKGVSNTCLSRSINCLESNVTFAKARVM